MKRLRQKKSSLLTTPRWLAYATAGAATALAGATSAEAEIHYSGILNLKFRNDFAHGGLEKVRTLSLTGGAELRFLRLVYAGVYFGDYVGVFSAPVSNQIRRGTRSTFARKLYSGQNISAGSFAQGREGLFEALVSEYGAGSFRNSGEGFIGFKFDVGNGTQYGWARVQMGKVPRHNFLVVDYAWADPGESIAAGQTSSAPDQAAVVPATGSLGLLALGGAGLMAWRKRRAKST